MASKKQKKMKAVAYTNGWPVAFAPLKQLVPLEFMESDDDENVQQVQDELLELPALAPGDCLKACNGSDIQLAQGTLAHPYLAKGRGRYLIILPGMGKQSRRCL